MRSSNIFKQTLNGCGDGNILGGEVCEGYAGEFWKRDLAENKIVSHGITILKNLVHRGAVGGDSRLGFSLPAEGAWGVAMLFLPRGEEKRSKARALVERVVAAEGGTTLGWREVPVNPDLLGEMAESTRPHISQLFAAFGALTGDALERRLYLARKSIESAAFADGFSMEEVYVNPAGLHSGCHLASTTQP